MSTATKAALVLAAVASAAGAEATPKPFSYGPFPGTRSALHYARRWAAMERSEVVSIDAAMKVGGEAHEPGPRAALLGHVDKHLSDACGGRPAPLNWTLHTAAVDEHGLRHAMLRAFGGVGPLQYVAVKDGAVLASDPPLSGCVLDGGDATATPRAYLRGRRLHVEHTQQGIQALQYHTEKQTQEGIQALQYHTGKSLQGLQHNTGETLKNAQRFGDFARTQWAESGIGIDPNLLHMGTPETTVGEPEEMLHPRLDHMSEDCAALFTRTAKEMCGTKMYVETTSAKMKIVDGYQLDIHAFVSGPRGRVAQKFECAILVPHGWGHEGHDHAAGSMLPEEDLGLETAIRMTVHICQADLVSSVNPQTAEAIGLAAQLFPGELSKYKGHRHVYDNLERAFADNGPLRLLEELPNQIDLVASFPTCFPQRGADVVQDQGTCGSCWAFAAASAMMNNICMKGNGQHSRQGTARLEISVQRIITCNSHQMGCDGGHASAAADTFGGVKMAMQRSVPYQCGHGSHESHFELQTGQCGAFPWGGNPSTSCDATVANTNWNFGGLYQVNGEQEMMSAVAQGNSLFTTILVPESLMYFSGRSVYREDSNTLGGHAVVTVGYGTYGGTPYWYVQNSWGGHWGDKGFFKMLRGTNFLQVEQGASYFRGWPVGSEEPPQIGTPTGSGAVGSMFLMIKKLLESLAAR